MELVYEHSKEELSKQKDISFSIDADGIYLIKVEARASEEKQLRRTDDEDLRIEIDKRKFPQLTNSKRYFDSPASFSGGTLKGLKKQIFLILPLKEGKHVISLITDISASLEKIEIFKISSDLSELELEINDQAEDGDRRPWITFALVDVGCEKFMVNLNLKKRFLDSDDVKVIIDGDIKRNNRSLLHKFWYFIASIFTGEMQQETFIVNLPAGLHYIEFWADRMPTFKTITFYNLKAANLNESFPEEIIKEKIRSEAEKVGLNPELMISIATWESHFDPEVISPAGAKGIFQLTDITIKDIDERFSFKIEDPFNVDQNITGAMLYFKWLLDRYEGDPEQIEKAIVAWNWGLNNFPKDLTLDWSKIPDATKAFVKNVLNK